MRNYSSVRPLKICADKNGSQLIHIIIMVRIRLQHFIFFALLLCGSVRAEINVDIVGVDSAVADNIRLHLSRWDRLPSGSPEAGFATLRPAIVNALQALGYYAAEINYQLTDERLVLRINPGAPVTWGEVTIVIRQGQQELKQKFPNLVQNNPFKKNEAINHQTYEDYKRLLVTTLRSEGYLDAKVTLGRMAVDIENLVANVTLEVESGPRFRIGDVEFIGTTLNTDLVSDIAKVPYNDWYRANVVGDVYNRLLNSAYFNSVIVEIERTSDTTVKLLVNLEDLPKHQISMGVGYGTDTRARGKFTWTRPRLNARGDSYSTQLQVSSINQEATFRYRIPWHHPLNRYFSWDSGWQNETTKDKEVETITTGASFNIVKDNGWQFGYHVDLEQAIFRQGSEPEQSDTYVIPSASFSRRKFRGDAADPDSGWKFEVNLAASSPALGSDATFQRADFSANLLYRFSEHHSILARGEIGVLKTDQLDKVPLKRRFYTGGDQTVRGYEFETIAPRDADGELTGGKYLDVASFEYRYHWNDNWKIALFADRGRAFNDHEQLPKKSAGIGLRWKSPVGLIAVDIAKPINESDEDLNSVRFHLYMGSPL